MEAAVGGERVANLILRTEKVHRIHKNDINVFYYSFHVDSPKLIHQRTLLRDERRRLRIATEQIEERKKALDIMKRDDWVPDALKNSDEKHIMMNVGGLMFEAPMSVLRRDKESLLSQICDPEPPVTPDPEGFFFFDRDW